MPFEKPRIMTDSEANTIRGKMLVGAATPAEQLLLVGHFGLVNGKLRDALENLRGCLGEKVFVIGEFGDRWSTVEPDEDGAEYEVVDFKELLD